MPRYHFPIVDGTKLSDPVGIELQGPEQARAQAEKIAYALSLATKHPRNVVVEDEEGKEIHTEPVNTQSPND